MSIFNKLSETQNYSSLIKDFNPANLNPEQEKLIVKYTTPSRKYIKESARGVNCKDVSSGTLQYIIETCYECSFDEKYKAILIAIYKTYLMYKNDKNIDGIVTKAKEELMPFVLVPIKKKVVDLSFLNDITKDYDDNFFYVFFITIGVNKFFKYGITDNKPRKRIAQIKSDIVKKYSKQAIKIEPVLIIHCEDVSILEDEVKVTLSENNINATNYDFKGASETFRQKDKDVAIENIILPLAKKCHGEVLYNSSISSPVDSAESLPTVEPVSPFETVSPLEDY